MAKTICGILCFTALGCGAFLHLIFLPMFAVAALMSAGNCKTSLEWLLLASTVCLVLAVMGTINYIAAKLVVYCYERDWFFRCVLMGLTPVLFSPQVVLAFIGLLADNAIPQW